MKNESNKQRNSAPTGAQDSENKLNADRPLGGAACSASFSDVREVYESTKRQMVEMERIHQEVMRTHQTIIDDCERVLLDGQR